MSRLPHRKRVRHYEEFVHFHELTFSCYRRMPLLTNDAWRRTLGDRLQIACEEERFQLVAFVFMPEHVHLLVLPADNTAKISRLLGRTKQPTSKAIKHLLKENGSPLLQKLNVRERPGKTCFRFWQEGPGYDRNLYSVQAVKTSIDYIHMNPVRRGLCKRATDWKWSSACFHMLGFQDLDLPRLTQTDPSWFHRMGSQYQL